MALNKEQEIEIQNAISQSKTTVRPISEELESILYKPINVLDHGFVRVIDYMGNDGAIVQAARVSYGTGTKQVSNDKGLIDYLMSHRHSSPFEMCEIKLHVKMPIFVARQWIRHRMASINEYSARYSIMDNEFYVPNSMDILPQSSTNNQGRDENKEISAEEQREVIEILKANSIRNYSDYTKMMNKDEDGNVIDEGKAGIARELARMNLSLNFYTQFYWKIDLHNLLHFLRLRADSHAQYEIRVYADAILNVVKSWVPHTFDAFMKYRMNGYEISSCELDVIRKMLKGQKISFENSGMSKREWRVFLEVFGINEFLE